MLIIFYMQIWTNPQTRVKINDERTKRFEFKFKLIQFIQTVLCVRIVPEIHREINSCYGNHWKEIGNGFLKIQKFLQSACRTRTKNDGKNIQKKNNNHWANGSVSYLSLSRLVDPRNEQWNFFFFFFKSINYFEQ